MSYPPLSGAKTAAMVHTASPAIPQTATIRARPWRGFIPLSFENTCLINEKRNSDPTLDLGKRPSVDRNYRRSPSSFHAPRSQVYCNTLYSSGVESLRSRLKRPAPLSVLIESDTGRCRKPASFCDNSQTFTFGVLARRDTLAVGRCAANSCNGTTNPNYLAQFFARYYYTVSCASWFLVLRDSAWGKAATLHRWMEEARKTGIHSLVGFVGRCKSLLQLADTIRAFERPAAKGNDLPVADRRGMEHRGRARA